MLLNAMQYAAKCSAFWCKTQGVLMLNARRNGAKCAAKSINIHANGINKTLSSYETHGQKGHNNH